MTNKKEKFDLQPHDIDVLADALTSLDRTSKIIARMATTSPRGKKGLKLTYQFKIKLRGITKPPVWRRVLVPAHFTFTGFHAVIQEAFGWWNVHLYCFCDRQYGRMLNIAEVREDDWGYAPDFDARKFTVGEFFGDGGIVNKLCYVYDFGDDWTHDITLEKVLDEYSDHATCITGKGACPEEDCGGQWGYEDMKENGEIDDPKFFDLEAAKASVEAVEPEGFGPW
ncbi:plasmid pRiA4b ORF-3 family protein [Hoylesella timonensis]|uniref:plasmid pRiA4b ORF-3 family protein n=1 Tax=Hoylesella timonensis TaxID=386414 RepID=UPI00242EBF5F|nr:plasmid pRiA4b ORF-3 family protein [Hoylesella timonensis]